MLKEKLNTGGCRKGGECQWSGPTQNKMPVSTPKPPTTFVGQGRHSGHFMPCAGYKSNRLCWIIFSGSYCSQSDPEIKRGRTDCQDRRTAIVGIFNNGCISRTIASSSLISTVNTSQGNSNGHKPRIFTPKQRPARTLKHSDLRLPLP